MKTILIVDDSLTVRNYHAAVTRSAGYHCLTAIDGADALETLYGHEIDLILTDINMEGMDGYELTRRVRADEKYQNLPILLMTSEKGEQDRVQGFAAGASLYLVKPCEPEVIMENIKRLIGE